MLDSLNTPALVIDQPTLQRNLATMAKRMAHHGVALRPHLKTAKSAAIARLAVAGQPGGITVSTLREAEYFATRGFNDIVLAVGIVAAKLPRVLALRHREIDLKLITDNRDTAHAIVAFAAQHQRSLAVLIEVDTGGRRAGVLADDDELLAIAEVLHQGAYTTLSGVLTHAGHSYHARSMAELRCIARDEWLGITRAAERLTAAGLPCPMVSAGSTPTATHAKELTGVTEMRPGVYMFQDLDQLGIGSCGRLDLALTVLARVIGHNRHTGHLLIDAGALALSKDLSAKEFLPEVGYGEVCDPHSLMSLGLYVRDVHQEHGLIPIHSPSLFERLPVGSLVRILPNHACITAAAYEQYQVVEDGKLVAVWDRANGW